MKAIEHNGLDVSLIKPDCGPKFSPNLYLWLTSKAHKNRAWAYRVYRDVDGVLWIGQLDRRELIGAKLVAVLCNGARESTAAWQNIDAEEVPNFWANYITDGRCAIDVDHSMDFFNDETRWRVAGDSRSCQWCGKVTQALKRWTESVQRQEWINP